MIVLKKLKLQQQCHKTATLVYNQYGHDCTGYNACHVTVYVGGSSKIQTLCHLTQVQLKLRFTAMERLSGY